MTRQEQAEQLFQVPPDPVGVDPDKGPLPNSVREALSWCLRNGVTEVKLPNIGEFSLRAQQPPHIPTLDEAKQIIGLDKLTSPQPDKKLAPGGYDPDILYMQTDGQPQ